MFKFLFLATVVGLGGCVANIPLTSQVPPVDYVSAQPLAVSVVDERQRVKDGKAKSFIGVAHATFGIPVDWHVKSVLAVEKGDKERDLSQFLQYRVVQGLVANGSKAFELPLTTSTLSDDDAIKLLSDRGASRLLLMKLNEWYFSINLNWVGAFNFDTDTEVMIYQAGKGKILQKRFAGRDVIDEQASQSPRNHILMAYRDQLAEILGDSEVKQALSGP